MPGFVSAILSFLGGLASSLILPIFAWLAGKRKAEGKQRDKVIEDVEKAKKVSDELDQLSASAIRERGKRWVRKRSDSE